MKQSGRVFVFVLLIVFVLHLQLDSAAQNPDLNSVMLTFSQAIRGLERRLENSDARAAFTHAKTLQEAAKQMSVALPQENPKSSHLCDEYLTAMNRLSDEMVSFAKDGDLMKVRHIANEVRSQCVNCHVRFRDGNGERGLFPATGNVITGNVEIIQQNGEKRADRANVLVFLEGMQGSREFPLPWRRPVISQKNRTYTPRVLPVVKGTTVEFPNDDNIFHNVFSLSKVKPFDLDIYPPQTSKSVTFSQTGWVKIYCNIHPDMICHIIILDRPFFSLTDENGTFVIPNVPDGEYTLRTWHEYGGEARTELQVVGAQLFQYALQIQEDKKFVQHKNKFGEPYRSKY